MAPSSETPGDAGIVVDPALGNPDAVRLRADLQRADWKSADAFLDGLRDWDARAFFVGALAEWDGRPPWLEDWFRAKGRTSATPLLVRGAHSINWAWEARGSGTGDTVDAAAAQLYLARLQNAERDLEQAALLAPDDPTPWAYLIVTAMGRSAGETILAKRFAQAVRRDPLNRIAHTRRLVSLTEKWGGSHDAMFRFAREAATKAPLGSSLHVLLPWAHVERWLGFSLAGDRDALGKYLARDDVKADLAASRGRFLGAPFTAPLFEANDRNIFAFLLWLGEAIPPAAEELRAIGARVTPLPWNHLGDPVSVFLRARAECLGVGDPKTEERIAEQATRAVEQAREAQVLLDGSPESLVPLDRLLARFTATLGQESDRDRKTTLAAALAFMFGAYAGEVVRRHLGGCWIPRATGQGVPMAALVTGGRVVEPLKTVILILLQGQGTLLQAAEKWGLALSPPVNAPSAAAPPPARSPAAENMRAEAELFVKACRETGSAQLSYDEASLAQVDTVVASVRAQLAGIGDAERRLTLAPIGVRLGAYIGEVLRRLRGAAWSEKLEGLPPGIAVVDMGGQTALTIAAAYGLLNDGATDVGEAQPARSVVEYYRALTRQQDEWLRRRLCGDATIEQLKAALSDDARLSDELYGLATSALLTGAIRWGLPLDFSEASLEGLESVLEQVHAALAQGPAPSDAQMGTMVTLWGVYFGEVIRRNRGGRWGYREVPNVGLVLALEMGGRSVFPLSRIEKRIRQGSSQPVRGFYQWIAGMAPMDEAALAAKPSESLERFARDALRVALGFVPKSGTEPMAPFLLSNSNGRNSVESYAMMSTDHAMPLARKRAAAQPPEVERVAFAYDGYVSIANQKKKDAILAECHERGSKYGFVFAQCYERGADGTAVAVGEPEVSPGPAYLGDR